MTARRFRRPALTAFLAATAAAAAAWFTVLATEDGNALAESTAPTDLAYELASVDVAVAGATDLEDTIRVSGEIKPAASASIRARVSGPVVAVHVRPGDAVRKGDTLVLLGTEDLDSTVLQRAYGIEAAEAQLRLAEQTLERTRELHGRGVASKSALDKAESDVLAAEANVLGLSAQGETALSALRDATVYAPFDGTVSARLVEPGEQVSAGTELMVVADVSTLEAEVLVPVRDVPLVKPGQRAVLHVDGHGGPTVRGTVDRVSPVANAGTRSVPVSITLDDPAESLWAGMFASGSITVREGHGVLGLPATAVVNDADGDHVLKIEDGILSKASVRVASTWNGGRTVVVEGDVKPGDTVLAAPLPGLDAGTRVTVENPS